MSTYVIINDEVKVEYNSRSGNKAPSRCFNIPTRKTFETNYGCFIVVLAGGTFYVDIGNEFAMHIIHLHSQPQEVKESITRVSNKVDYDVWKKYIVEM